MDSLKKLLGYPVSTKPIQRELQSIKDKEEVNKARRKAVVGGKIKKKKVVSKKK